MCEKFQKRLAPSMSVREGGWEEEDLLIGKRVELKATYQSWLSSVSDPDEVTVLERPFRI